MAAHKPLTRRSLHRHLYRLLARPTTKLVFQTVRDKGAGHVKYDPDYWPPYDVTITIDANNGEQIHYIIHELLHVIYSPLIAPHMDETLEELVIVSLDTYMSDWIKSSRSRRLKWEQLIEEKLAEARTAAPLYTLEERVDRS